MKLNRAEPRAHQSRLARPAVLIVDDNPQSLELLSTWVGELPADVVVADDGIAALEQVSQRRPDLIVLDVMMPRLSGFQVCRKLKEHPETSEIPILMLTALHEYEDVEAAHRVGTDDFLSKPVSKIEFLNHVKKLLSDESGSNSSGGE